MKKNIGITDGFGEDKDFSNSHNFFKYIQKQNPKFNFFSIDWKSIDKKGNSKAINLKSEKFEKINVKYLDLFHILFLGKVANEWDEFYRVLDNLNSLDVNVINPIETIKYSINKQYMLDLQEELPLIKTKAVSSNISLDELKYIAGDSYKIVKPLNGERGLLVNKLENMTKATLKKYSSLTPTLLLQPFIEEINLGERHLIYLGDNFSHGIIKTPCKGKFKVNSSAGSTAVSYAPTEKEIKIGFDVKKKFKHPLVAYRVDLVSTKEGPKIMEIEAVNPSYHSETVGNENTQAQRLGQFYRIHLSKRI